MPNQLPFHIQALKREFERRRKKNPQYSLRAYARSLELDPSALCRILAEKQPLSLKAAKRIQGKLNLSSDELHQFLLSVVESKSAETLARAGLKTLPAPSDAVDPQKLQQVVLLTRRFASDLEAIMGTRTIARKVDQLAWMLLAEAAMPVSGVPPDESRSLAEPDFKSHNAMNTQSSTRLAANGLAQASFPE